MSVEIGVKHGGSLALWRHLFPEAEIVRLDIGLSKAVRHEGIIYIEGDQTDTDCLKAIAGKHGPFDLVIDDGSHIGRHQLISLSILARFLEPSGFYVIEDIHTVLKPHTIAVDYGHDVWPQFIAFLLDYLRGYPPKINRPNKVQTVAMKIAPLMSYVTLAHNSIILRREPRSKTER